jgi:hypothetical protein
MSNVDPKIAICFFGITRSLTRTVHSIEKNVVGPARKYGDLRIYSHFFLQGQVDNPRSGEAGSYDIDEYRLLESDWLRLEEPDICLEQWNFEYLCEFGDYWKDDYRSIRNLVHQLHSLRQVTLAALEDEADICIFCRPDLIYHDSFNSAIRRALGKKVDRVQLPYWQSFGGLNDRFAICTGTKATKAYGRRIELAEAYCEERGMLHSERLVAFSLHRAKIGIKFTGVRASRVRINGSVREESFQHPRVKNLRASLGAFRRKILGTKASRSS